LLISWTSFFTQLIPYASISVFLWFIFADPKTRFRDWLVIILSCLAVPLLKLQEFRALLTLAPLSHMHYTRTVADAADIISRISSGSFLFGSAPRTSAMALMVSALIVLAGRRKRIASILSLAILCDGFFSLASIWFQQAAVNVFPFLSRYTVQYFGPLGGQALALGAGAGVHALWPRFKDAASGFQSTVISKSTAFVVATVAIAIIVYPTLKLKYANGLNWVTRGTFVRHFESPILKELSAKIRTQPFPERVEGYQITSAILSGYGLETAGGDPPLHYRRYYEFFAKMVEPWARGILDDKWYGPLHRLKHEKFPGKMMFRAARLMFFPTEYNAEVRLDALYHLNLMSLTNIAYIVSRDRLIAPGLQEIRSRSQPWSALSHAD